MKKQLLYLFFLAITISTTAQNYQWDWAQSGGGTQSVTTMGNSFDYWQLEAITSIKIDSNNNYYFLARSGGGTTTFEGVPYTNYENTPSGSDMFLFSTTCDGAFRWKKSIGSINDDRAISIAIDASNNIYVAGSNSSGGAPNDPIRFDTDFVQSSTVPSSTPGPHNKNLYVIKYDDQGFFQWLYQPQRDMSPNTTVHSSFEMFIDTSGIIHWLIAINQGTHQNGSIVVTSQFQMLVLKIDGNGNYLSHFDSKITGGLAFNTIQFHFDELINRYYFGLSTFSVQQPIFYDGVANNGQMSIVAIDNLGNQIWRKNNMQGGILRDIVTDDQSNVYFCGMNNNRDTSMGSVPNDSMAGYSFNQVSSSGGGLPANFLIKLNPAGNLLWGTNNDSFAVEPAHTIVLNGNEVAIGSALIDTTWDGLSFVRGNNSNYDPVVVRFNATTGSIIAIEDIRGDIGLEDNITAMALDNFGNYVVGGYMRGNLFVNNDPNVPQINKNGGNADFWIARLAKTDCQGVTLSMEEVAQEGFSIYPNPASNEVKIQALGNATLSSYTIYSITGQQVAYGTDITSSINISNLNTGIYLMQLTSNTGEVSTLKLVKK